MPTINLPKKHREIQRKNSKKSSDDNHRWVYNTRTWRELRLQFLSENPLCSECKKSEKFISAVEVHHIKEISKFKEKQLKQFWGFNVGNLKGLCSEHHKLEHQLQRSQKRKDEILRIRKLIEENRKDTCI